MKITAIHHPDNLALSFDFTGSDWQKAVAHNIHLNWQGDEAPVELHTTARVLWTSRQIIFGYECHYTELDRDAEFEVNEERHGLWDRDVCEAFVRSPNEPDERCYKEFEVAPTAQWIDLSIDRTDMTKVWNDWKWASGMKTLAHIDEDKKIWRAVMAIPFTAFGAAPQVGDQWEANLFRISRLNGVRHFLAYSPTLTEKPNYHVPEKFVKLKFEQAG